MHWYPRPNPNSDLSIMLMPRRRFGHVCPGIKTCPFESFIFCGKICGNQRIDSIQIGHRNAGLLREALILWILTPCFPSIQAKQDYLSWFAYACLRLPVVFWFCLRGLRVLLLGASVVSWGCVFCTSGYCYTRLQTKHRQIKMQGCETPRIISQQQNTTSSITTKHFLQHRLRRKKY